MSFTRQCSIWCEEIDCHAWVGEEDTVADARRIARMYGWKRRDGRDYCPEHAATGRDVGTPPPSEGVEFAREQWAKHPELTGRDPSTLTPDEIAVLLDLPPWIS